MASLYQRFGGKINTSRSFPVTPEASHLLGPQCSEEDGAAAAAAATAAVASAHAVAGAAKASRSSQPHNPRPRFQYQARRSDGEEEDVSQPLPDSGGRTRVGESWAPLLFSLFVNSWDVSYTSRGIICVSSLQWFPYPNAKATLSHPESLEKGGI
uniref:Uncharacterized protein n=1 Tax=Naja naja TaxID=35670 RepID=A0A8C6Y603_NAJNA